MGSQSSSASKGKGRLEKISWRKAGLDQEWKEKRRTETKGSSETEEAAWEKIMRGLKAQSAAVSGWTLEGV